MKKEVELAKKLLESKGYIVSKSITESSDKFKVGDMIVGKESSNFYRVKEVTPTHYICDDLQGHGTAHLLKSKVYKNFSLEESEEYTESSTNDYYYLRDIIDTWNMIEKYNLHYTESYKGIRVYKEEYDELMKSVKNPKYLRNLITHPVEEFKDMNESGDLKYVSNVNGYSTYRKIENGKGVWYAKRQDDPDDKMFPITYDQARGYEEMPNPTEIEKLQRKSGKMLPPENEDIEESSDIPHTEQYKGYYIKSYDNFGATVYMKNKKIGEFENIDDAREYIDEVINRNNLKESIRRKLLRESSSKENNEFQIGDIISYSMLYGGTVRAKVVDRTSDKLVVRENWVAEDTWEDASTDEEYTILTNDEGVEYIVTWEYHGEKGVVYPPHSKYSNN